MNAMRRHCRVSTRRRVSAHVRTLPARAAARSLNYRRLARSPARMTMTTCGRDDCLMKATNKMRRVRAVVNKHHPHNTPVRRHINANCPWQQRQLASTLMCRRVVSSRIVLDLKQTPVVHKTSSLYQSLSPPPRR
jgi:hypothetical protein